MSSLLPKSPGLWHVVAYIALIWAFFLIPLWSRALFWLLHQLIRLLSMPLFILLEYRQRRLRRPSPSPSPRPRPAPPAEDVTAELDRLRHDQQKLLTQGMLQVEQLHFQNRAIETVTERVRRQELATD